MLTERIALRLALGAAHLPRRVPATLLSHGPRPRPLSRTVRFVFAPCRTYATPAKPKKGSIGESSARVKRAVKKVASTKTTPAATTEESVTDVSTPAAQPKAAKARASPSEGEDEDPAAIAKAAAKKEKERVKKAAAATKKATAKKERKQAKTAKVKEAATAKKAKAKEAAKAKQAKTKEAAKIKAAKRKTLTPAQSAKRKAVLERAEITKLRTAALSPPSAHQVSAWNLYAAEKLAAKTGSPSTSALKEASSSYKGMTPAEHEHYNHLASESNVQRQAARTSWLQSHTPEQIRAANAARSRLRTKTPKGSKKWRQIQDDRLVARPLTAYSLFTVDRFNSGDFKGIVLPEASKLASQEWKALSSAEKQKYGDLHSESRAKYEAEYQAVYGHAVRTKAAAAAAATTATATA